jgi:O-antigen ligase
LLGLALAFAGWTLAINDSFYLRLAGGQDDFTSGRWSSLGYWLALAGDHPWGLGLGAVRELLADGRPALGGDAYLEWPHNEFVRLYVEAGPPGLLFVTLLLALLVRRGVQAARDSADPVLRALILAIVADLVAEACLQNLLNAVYHATVLVLILGLAVAGGRRVTVRTPAVAMPLAQPAASR